MEEFKRQWEDWYGDLVTDYQWHEFEYRGRSVLYVSANALIDIDGSPYMSTTVQVIGYMDSRLPIEEGQKEEVAGLLKRMHAIDNVSFWSA